VQFAMFAHSSSVTMAGAFLVVIVAMDIRSVRTAATNETVVSL